MTKQLTLREIDALVAEKVMGHAVGYLKDAASEPDDEYPSYLNTATGKRLSGLMYRAGDLMEGDAKLSPYSSDIAAAWEVVEEVRQRPGLSDVMRQPDFVLVPSDDGEWLASFGRFGGKAPTAPTAISLAALAAAGEDVEVMK